MEKFEMGLWGLDFLISGIGFWLGGPFGAILCFLVGGVLILAAVVRKEGMHESVLVDTSNNPYPLQFRRKWHKWALGLCVVVLVPVLIAGALKFREPFKTSVAGPKVDTVVATEDSRQSVPGRPAPSPSEKGTDRNSNQDSHIAHTVKRQASTALLKPTNVGSSGSSRPAIGIINQGSGSAISFNQSGGITAGTVNIGAVERHIKNRDAVIGWLSQGAGVVNFNVVLGDSEAAQYAEEWRFAFQQAGWRVQHFGYAFHDSNPRGILVLMHGDAETQPGRFEVFPTEPAYFVAQALTIEGINLNGHRKSDVPVGEVDVWVGAR